MLLSYNFYMKLAEEVRCSDIQNSICVHKTHTGMQPRLEELNANAGGSGLF